MNVFIPTWTIELIKWCFLVGLGLVSVGCLFAGLATVYEARHKASDVYKRSMVMWHLAWCGKRINEITIHTLKWAFTEFLEEHPPLYRQFEHIIEDAKRRAS